MNQPRYYCQDFDEPTVSRWFWLVPLVIIATLTHAGAFFYGDFQGSKRVIAQAEAIVKANARRATPAINPPPSLIDCTKHGREEFFRTCRARMRSGLVGGK